MSKISFLILIAFVAINVFLTAGCGGGGGGANGGSNGGGSNISGITEGKAQGMKVVLSTTSTPTSGDIVLIPANNLFSFNIAMLNENVIYYPFAFNDANGNNRYDAGEEIVSSDETLRYKKGYWALCSTDGYEIFAPDATQIVDAISIY